MTGSRVDFRLYLITDRKVLSSHFSLLSSVEEALKGGVKAVQLREKDLGTRELLDMAYKMREITNKYKTKLFINDRVDMRCLLRLMVFILGRRACLLML